ncbi:MAG TPA: AMP-binding protein [Caulobacteraceae bacterium]|jgi:acyl-CoA synthetase (AMP-forming)/AMP-acid ligase II/acyl carrier protein
MASVRSLTIAQTLQLRAARQGERVAFRELRNDLTERDRVTYGDLDRRARVLGQQLSRQVGRGARALIWSPGAIDYLIALFACFYSGVTAVSGVPPYAPSARTQRHEARLGRLRTVVETSGLTAILGPAETIDRVGALLAGSPGDVALVATDDALAATPALWAPVTPTADDIVLLQYTSGSTTSPGGVVLRHRNLSSNLEAQATAFAMSEADVGVSWLPMFHDLGLIGAGLLPVHAGFPCVLMPAAGFLEQPQRWLQVVSDEAATISWAPNFAYGLCLRAMAPEARAGLDLRRWRIAMNAAEPVQAETVRRFAEGFAVARFQANAMYPAYGLAEATLAVTAPSPGQRVHIVEADRAALSRDRLEPPSPGAAVTELVGCGHPVPGVELAIVDPLTLRRRPADVVGEIWVSGPGRSEGYYGEGDARSDACNARISGEIGAWLRTGDLGFIKDGDLFITGRLKDVIILRGANIYPQDMEATATASHPALREDCACAVSVDAGGEEAVAIVCEIDRRQHAAAPEAAAAIRRAIFERHGLETHAVVLIRQGNLPKTPSGKLQRRACRDLLGRGALPSVIDDRLPSSDRRTSPSKTRPADADAPTWILVQLRAEAPGAEIAPETYLADLGLSSVRITELAGEIEALFGQRIAAADLFEMQRVSDLIARLSPPA